MKTCLLIACSLLAACADPPGLDAVEDELVRDLSCTGADVRLYTGTNYTGSEICYEQVGGIRIPNPWRVNVQSYKTGSWAGTLEHHLPQPPVHFGPLENVPVASWAASQARTLYITTDVHVDASPDGP